MLEDKQLTEKESLDLIATMINKAKDSCHDTGVSAMMWGTVITVCSLVRLTELHFGFKLPFDIYLLTFVALIPQVILSVKKKKKRKVKSYNDDFMYSLWPAFGICIALLIHAINIIGPKFDGIYEFVAPLFLILYGMPTFVTGLSMKFRPMLWGGIFCWVCSVITVYTNIKIDLLLTAASALLAWFIPGLIMEKDYRLAKKQQAALNV